MARKFSEAFYNSAAWRKTRKLYVQSKNYTCERCGKATTNLIVHHKIYLTPKNINNPEITLNWNNLECLCIDCHNEEHIRKYGATAEDLMFDSMGNLVKR